MWFAITILAVGAWKILRNTAKAANRLTEDLTDSEAQAVKFYGYFGIVKFGGVASATPILKTSTLQLVGWLARNVNDWPVVQDSFTTLCGNNYTIFQAASTAMDTTNYNAFVTLN